MPTIACAILGKVNNILDYNGYCALPPYVVHFTGPPSVNYQDTKENAHIFAMRIRSSTLTYSFTVDGTPYAGSIDSFMVKLDGNADPVNERSLPCALFVGPVFANADLPAGSGVRVYSWDNVNKKFYYKVDFTLLGSTGGGLLDSDSGSFSTPVISGITGSAFGNSFPIYFESGTVASSSGTVDITIKDYWEYDNGVRGPLWDSATGAKLQPIPTTF